MAEKTKIEKVTDAAKKLSSPLASLLGKQETIKSLKEKKKKRKSLSFKRWETLSYK